MVRAYYIMLQWTEQFSTGSGRLDQQHRMLIDNINQLEGLLTVTNPTRDDCEFMMRLVGFLENYSEQHFQMEEQCMEFFRCPSHAENKLAHKQFMSFFDDFKEQYQSKGFRREIMVWLHETVSQWIVEHILRVDIRLKACIKN